MSQIHNQGFPHEFAKVAYVTTDLPTLGTNPKYSQCKSETQEAKDLNDLHSLGQTVRVEAADCPRGPSGLSASTGQTVRKCHPNFQYYTSKNGVSVEHSRTVRASRTVRPPRADCLTNSSQQKTTNETDRNTDTQEHLKNTTNTQSAVSSWTVCDSLEDCQPRADRAARPRTHKHQTTYPSMDLPNGLSS
jgi:hypothetical protein